jgi:hypothetical protein
MSITSMDVVVCSLPSAISGAFAGAAELIRKVEINKKQITVSRANAMRIAFVWS